MPIDPRIALGVQPLQVQFRDPIASYNQLAQMQSNDTQNQLAQMQMQEARQLAPYRMQQTKMQAASAQLTYDQAKQAQDFVTGVMSKAAENSDGKAPTDPSEAAMQMLQHPNPQVQAIGGHLLDASQKLMAFRQQAQFMKDEGGAAPTLAGAPAAVASGLVDNVDAPMVASGTPAPNVASALSRFVAGTKDMPDGSVGPYFSIGGQPVSEEQYLSGREAIMLPKPVNSLAPADAAAPAVNAMIPAVASALQNADSLKKEIEKGDRTYGQAPGWKSKRELLVKAFEQALKPGAVGTKSEFERLLDESGLSATEKQDMRKAKLAKETAKPSDRPEPKSEFEKLLAESGLTEDQKQEMRKAKIAKETAKPADKPETKSEFEKLLAESGLTEDQKQAARQAKITKETTAPTFQAERKSDFEKLLEDSGLSENEKQAMRKAKLTKETSPSAAADSQFERTMTALGLSDDKKNAMRRQLLAKELRVPSEGGAGGERLPVGSMLVIDPADPTGKKIITVTTARAIKEGLTPASSAKEGGATEGERKAATLLQRLQFSESQLTEALVNNPNAAKPGVFSSAVAMLSTPLANSLTPEARQRVQSAQLDILDAALTLGTGAAYTREQLEGYREAYFPQIGDKPNQIKDKQARLNNVINAAKIAAGKAAKLVPAPPSPAAASSAMSAADAILKKGK
jgi:hypothetical protein